MNWAKIEFNIKNIFGDKEVFLENEIRRSAISNNMQGKIIYYKTKSQELPILYYLPPDTYKLCKMKLGEYLLTECDQPDTSDLIMLKQ